MVELTNLEAPGLEKDGEVYISRKGLVNWLRIVESELRAANAHQDALNITQWIRDILEGSTTEG